MKHPELSAHALSDIGRKTSNACADLRALPLAIGTCANLLRALNVEREEDDEHRHEWATSRNTDALLSLIHAASAHLYTSLAFIVGEDDGDLEREYPATPAPEAKTSKSRGKLSVVADDREAAA